MSRNAYAAQEARDITAAQLFHSWQAAQLAGSRVYVTLASTLPALSKATGLALVLAATGEPYLISFIARPEGALLDGTPLHEAITTIDTSVRPQPFAYMINCTHASFARTALKQPTNSSPLAR